MEIIKSTLEDITEILTIYDMAIHLQKIKGAVPWPKLDKNRISQEIEEGKQWKLVIERMIVCVWVVVFDDKEIWGAKNDVPSLYLHRIATRDTARGKRLSSHVFAWAKEIAKTQKKQFIRLDTVGKNHGLIKFYQNQGFDYLGTIPMGPSHTLPKHYHNNDVCLFEMKVE